MSNGTATARRPATKPIDLVDIYRERAEARAYLVMIGDMDLHDAVDGLQADAERDGLVERLGQDAVQAILAKAFGWRP
jgi:hypothetical protein